MGSLQTGVLINSQSIRNVDQELSQQTARHLQREKPDCCLLYLEGPNITGTHFGFSSEPYLEAVEQAGTFHQHHYGAPGFCGCRTGVLYLGRRLLRGGSPAEGEQL